MSTDSQLILPELISARAKTHPDLNVLIFEDGGLEQKRTYQQLWVNSQKLAFALQSVGVKTGDRFAILMQNHPEFVEAMIAAGILGAIFVPIDPRTKGEKLAFMLRDAECCGVICGDYVLEPMLDAAKSVDSLKWFFTLGDEPDKDIQGLVGKTFASLDEHPAADIPVAVSDEREPMQIMYTSGTTGDPKGIIVRHARFVFVSQQGESVFGYQSDERPYTGLSLTHGNAQFVTLAPVLYMGLEAVISRKFTKSRLWTIVRKYQCTTFALLGGMVTAIYSEPQRPDDLDNTVRFVVSAGMPKVIWEDFARRFDVQIVEFYGAMEGGMTINRIGEGPVGSCGRVPPGLAMKVVDEDGNEVPVNSPGELLFRPADGSPAVVEYYNNPAASAKKTDGGWLHSGDVVTVDEAGWVFYQYRQGGGIRHNGDFIIPAYIEKVVAEHPEVSDVAVFGVPAVSGAPGEQDVVAAIETSDGSEPDGEALLTWCRIHLEANMVPSSVLWVDALPKTASEKVQPRFLLSMFQHKDARIFRPQAIKKNQ